jgi:hypothetical protein
MTADPQKYYILNYCFYVFLHYELLSSFGELMYNYSFTFIKL